MKSTSDVQREFDAIALASRDRPEAAGLYDDVLLSFVPDGCRRALEIGCGTGRFTRALAGRAALVTAVDLSERMLDAARARSAGARIDYRGGDALDLVPQLGQFDLVVSLATFHHLPQEAAARCFTDAVAPGGTLILHDLWRGATTVELAIGGVRLTVKALRLLLNGAPLRYTPRERAAWREHANGDEHLTRREVRALRDRSWPDAALHEHFLWRYTIVWRRPA
jgi:2-polyprenyl-3-methyl-5-hydroxy-6-metoxy-1,4-benzoquinol methylase